MKYQEQSHVLAIELAEICEDQSQKVVFAESCTCGLVAATMAAVPGVSRFLCGSLATYREQTKIELLGIEPELLRKHSAVSAAVTEKMAVNSLDKVGESNWAAAVTGHLGPNAPNGLDGKIFVAVAKRSVSKPILYRLAENLNAISRIERQQEATCIVLNATIDAMKNGQVL